MRRILWVFFLVVGCGKGNEPASKEKPDVPAGSAAPRAPIDAAPAAGSASDIPALVAPVAHRVWTPRIDDAGTFDAYSQELGGERFAKFVIDLHSDAIYYFDVNVYKVHKDFIFQALYHKEKTKEAVRVFDKNYTSQKTDFMMCYLVHHLAADVWTFAFWDGDTATPDHVKHAYKRMKETFFLGDKVKFRPDSSFQENVAKKLGADVPVILNDQIYQAADYVAFNQGSAVGTLRLVPPNAVESELTFDPGEIVVLHTPLSDITPVAGIVSEQFSTPLSHVSLRARAWGIPNVGLHGAVDKLKALAGKVVFFEAKGGTYTLREATPAEVLAATARTAKPTHVDLPVADLSIEKFATLDEMRAKDVVAYGTKASNLGEIVFAKLPGFLVPPGFGVPFREYAAHMKSSGADALVTAALADKAFAKDPAVRKKTLAAIRQKIVDAPPSPALVASITTGLAALPGADGGVFVRSSTNAEDLPTFNGAGLYDTVPNMHGPDAVAGAVKQVWASVWNYPAYEDRQRAGIDHTKVYGGVLVQVGVNATAAGVLVTTHPTDPSDDKNYTINAKSGLGLAVVDGKKVPESLIVSWYNHGIRVLSRSAEDTKLVFDTTGGVREVPNPDKGKPVLSNDMAVRLADAARRLTKLFQSDRLDIEWVYAGTQLYIVQTRPLIQ